MYLSNTGGLGQPTALDPTIADRTTAILQDKIRQGERDVNKLASEAFWDRHRMDQWGKCKITLPSVKDLRQLHREWISLRDFASTLLSIRSVGEKPAFKIP